MLFCWQWRVLVRPRRHRQATWAWHRRNYTWSLLNPPFVPNSHFGPWEIFTQVSRNHSAAGADTDLTRSPPRPRTRPCCTFFLRRRSKDALACVSVFGSSAFQGVRMSQDCAALYERVLVSPRSPRLYVSRETVYIQYISLFLFCIALYAITTRYVLCMLYLCYGACKKNAPFETTEVPFGGFFPHTHCFFKMALGQPGPPATIKSFPAAVPGNAIAKKPQLPYTTLCVPRSVRAVPSEPGGQLRLHFLCDFNLRTGP